MKKLIYTGAIAALALSFTACSEAQEEMEETVDEMEMTDEVEEVSEEKTEQLNETLEIQEKAENLEAEMNEFIESI